MTEKYFVSLLEKELSKNGYLTKREVGVGYGIADLVLFKLDSNNCLIRKNHKQYKSIENEDYFRIFDLLPEMGKRKKVDIEFIINRLKISRNTLKYKYLKKLQDDNFIKIIDDQYYYKINGWMPIAKEIIAIEAKLKNWKRGILQANRYKSFANKVYLAMPSSQEHLIDKKLLEKHEIGLIILNLENKGLEITNLKPKKALNKYKFNLAAESILNKKILNEFSA